MRIITPERVAIAIRADSDEDLAYLERLAEEASQIVLDYLKQWPETWTGPDDVPLHIQSATALVAISLDEKRDENPINEGVRSILMRSRDPAFA